MSRRSRKDDFIHAEPGREDSAVGAPMEPEPEDAAAPSRTARKNASEELQQIGAELVTLRADLFAGLPLPEQLREALIEAKRLTSFGAQRRQAQFIGKLMRRLEPETLAAVHEALRAERGQSAKDTQLLQRAGQWRDSLIADDERLEGWLERFPGTDAEQLRALMRQARKESGPTKPGDTPRHGRAYRQIFAVIRAHLRAADGGPQSQQ